MFELPDVDFFVGRGDEHVISKTGPLGRRPLLDVKELRLVKKSSGGDIKDSQGRIDAEGIDRVLVQMNTLDLVRGNILIT